MIAFRDVHKAFGPKRVLEGFSLEVPDGQTTVIVGHSGAGKSVALKLVVGLLEPDHGAVEVDGLVVHLLERERLTALRARIGFVFQFAALFDSMTVAENLALGLRRQGVAESEIADRSAEALAVVGLAGTEARIPSELSGGMRKRAGLARAMALDPDILLVDEPSAGLDPITADEIDELLVHLKKTGTTLVMVTHDIPSARHVADALAMLHEGHLVARGTAAELDRSDNPLVRAFMRAEI